MTKEGQKRVNRATHTAEEFVRADGRVRESRRARFNQACDALETQEEKEAVYDILRARTWYQAAARALS